MNAPAVAAIAAAVLLTLWALLSPREKALPRAMGVTVAMYILIPSFGPPRIVSALPLIASVVLLALAMLRDPSPRTRQAGTVLVVVFIAFYSLTWIANDSLLSLGLIGARTLSLVLVAAVAARLSRRSRSAALTALVAFVPVEAALAILEQTRALPYVWVREQTSTYLDITNRQNELAGFLAGRSMGTFAHPILLGTFAAVALVLCVTSFAATRRWRYLVLALTAAGTLVLSGTRSAAAAAAVSLVLWLLLRRGRQLVLRVLIGIGLVVAALNLERVIAKVFDSTVIGSVSYIHRSRVLGSVPNLLARDDLPWLFGSGAGGIPELFQSGVVSGYGSFQFFDNMYVCLLAVSGVLGLTLFAVVVCRGLFVGNGTSRAVLAVMLIMMASFDTLSWDLGFLFTVLAVVPGLKAPLATGRRAEGPAAAIDPVTAEEAPAATATASRNGHAR